MHLSKDYTFIGISKRLPSGYNRTYFRLYSIMILYLKLQGLDIFRKCKDSTILPFNKTKKYNHYIDTQQMPINEPIDSSSQQPINEPDLQHANAILDSITTSKDSQPTKLRVKNFKNRVFNLLKIYTNESQNLNPLISCLKQEMFFSQPEKMQELLHAVLNKQNVTEENLKQLAEYYKVILLYKSEQKGGDAIAQQFVRLMKKLAGIDSESVNTQILSMLKSFAYERKCRLNINFFFYFFRKYEHPQEIKKVFIEKLNQFVQDQKLRNAQKKQLIKILQRLDKSTRVKKGHVKKQEQDEDKIQEQENDDDIKAINKKKTGFADKVKKHEEDNKIEQQGEQKNRKKVSQQQQQKLERIKANKKKNRKGGNQGQGQSQKPQQSQKNHNQSTKNHRPNHSSQQNFKHKENRNHSESQEKKSFNKNTNKKNPQENNQPNHQKNHSQEKKQHHSNEKREQSNSKPKFNKNHQSNIPNNSPNNFKPKP